VAETGGSDYEDDDENEDDQDESGFTSTAMGGREIWLDYGVPAIKGARCSPRF